MAENNKTNKKPTQKTENYNAKKSSKITKSSGMTSKEKAKFSEHNSIEWVPADPYND